MFRYLAIMASVEILHIEHLEVLARLREKLEKLTKMTLSKQVAESMVAKNGCQQLWDEPDQIDKGTMIMFQKFRKSDGLYRQTITGPCLGAMGISLDLLQWDIDFKEAYKFRLMVFGHII